MPDQLSTVVDASSAGRSPGGCSDCVIITKEERSQSGLKIVQVIEGLSWHPDERRVRVLLDIISHNTGNQVVRYRVIHRGGVSAELHKLNLDDAADKRQPLLNQLYGDRIAYAPDDRNCILFRPRVNGCGIFQGDPIRVSLAGPGRCHDVLSNGTRLEPELRTLGSPPAFTSFVLPPPELCEAILPGEISLCRLHMEICPETYKSLVGDGSAFSVDSHARLMRDIKRYDLPGADEGFSSLYRDKVEAEGAVIAPKAYDIVLFQDLGQPVDVDCGSISITPAYPADSAVVERLEGRVLWFFGEPEPGEFYLSLRYADRSRVQNDTGRAKVLT